MKMKKDALAPLKLQNHGKQYREMPIEEKAALGGYTILGLLVLVAIGYACARMVGA